MEEMCFSKKQPPVTVTNLDNGLTDVRVLTEEEETETEEKELMYKYKGNQFRTVYTLTADQVANDLEKYLAYDSAEEPTLEELESNQAAIDAYTLQLIEEGVLA